jgi:hypothetical protein
MRNINHEGQMKKILILLKGGDHEKTIKPD